jgi:hypothetical protein
MLENDRPYEVGYGKPPKSGQFTKGNSGNPKGRPKGSKNLASIVMQECGQRVRVNGPRSSRTVAKLEAVVMQLGNKAAQGDLRATRDFLPLVERSEDAMNSASASPEIHELDKRFLQSFLRRMQALQTDEVPTSQPSSGKESDDDQE